MANRPGKIRSDSAFLPLTASHDIDWHTLAWLLMADVRETLQEPLSRIALDRLHPVLDTLVTCLRNSQQDPGADGELLDILAQYPLWAEKVHELQAQRAELTGALEELSIRIQWNQPVVYLAFLVDRLLGSVIRQLSDIRRQERALLQEAYYCHLGLVP